MERIWAVMTKSENLGYFFFPFVQKDFIGRSKQQQINVKDACYSI